MQKEEMQPIKDPDRARGEILQKIAENECLVLELAKIVNDLRTSLAPILHDAPPPCEAKEQYEEGTALGAEIGAQNRRLSSLIFQLRSINEHIAL